VQKGAASALDSRYIKISWGVTVVVVVAMLASVLWHPLTVHSSPAAPAAALNKPQASQTAQANVSLPEMATPAGVDSVARQVNDHTIAPTHAPDEEIDYTVQKGDSVFGIAKQFNISPDSVLWANYDILNDNPDMLSPGQVLKIPPTNGVYYKVQPGDTLESVAAVFKANLDDILNYSGNKIDLTNPTLTPGQYLMVVGGSRAFRQWLIPTIPRGPAGVMVNLIGTGGCDTSKSGGYVGSGYWVWPADNHYLSGNDYYPGHLGIDIAAGLGASVYAADSGLVVYAGWAYGGYGNMVLIDHNNGYQTLYAHLSVLEVHCGEGVGRGQQIGKAGMTGGTSTGPHLHFEVRYLGGFINPWIVLPPT
jgi:murein DD-endopeptidase MepM/ murein hydrolase activator NlpD